ncbi:hypothetical protein CRV15_27760 [Streptomyces clavuligerus]|nr:hypothetical protein D1794_28405 [Streptomyces clavuligerus]QCS09068.1 hypothetical protein CRV15_27760 [Streptomyces clavuligerus]
MGAAGPGRGRPRAGPRPPCRGAPRGTAPRGQRSGHRPPRDTPARWADPPAVGPVGTESGTPHGTGRTGASIHRPAV